MKYSQLLFILLWGLAVAPLSAQFTNNGTTITIEAGSEITLPAGQTHTNSGVIIVDGTLSVAGSLTNTSAILSNGNSGVLEFTGNAPANFTVGNTTVATLVNRKNFGSLSLLGSGTLRINEELDFSTAIFGSQIILNGVDMVLGPDALSTNATVGRYVNTNSSGEFGQRISSAGTYTAPIGNNGYAPLEYDITGGLFSSSEMRFSARATQDPNLPADATDYLNRHWDIDAFLISNLNLNLTATYLPGDVVGDANLIKGAAYTDDWTHEPASAGINQVQFDGLTEDGTLTGMNYFGRVNPKAFLQGAYSGGTMRTDLADDNLIPLTSPYADAPATAANVPFDAVDWVKVEVRDENDLETVLKSISAFLLADGTVVNPDGSSILRLKDAPTTAYIAVQHRNHLPAVSAATIDLSGTPELVDLTDLAQVYNNPGVTNAPVRSLGGGNHGLWSGDVNGNGLLTYNGGGNDRTSVLIGVGFGTPNNVVSGYRIEDVNLDGNVIYNGGGSDRTPILINVGFGTPNAVIRSHID